MTGLDPGIEYEFRLVARAGSGDDALETRSPPRTILVGPNRGRLHYDKYIIAIVMN